ncbi:shikimate kinase [Alkalihalophilus marmarensis]|jgi:shikimate kinase|uniref:Shikimate kinase n=1 Tax=Alkalihalophilus marmarensis DSM 21297 TaxID=1188261 RepID=U6SNU4_9BACI|nr:shikimate kinase [Alkalihalophilus marmarensis]ERN53052.1 shikimate kinase [Alkalihalophilus marmarensis DSM 21297]MCM3489047.1 shikimate kinase [Alkalihalophilus marmarensis]
MNDRIYLTGFMGSGKTTVGQALGKTLGFQVIDTDQWIEEDQQKKIKEIFNEGGEKLFRSLETEALRELSQKKAVITTGGGIILKEENRKIMKESGTVIFLDCAIEEVIRRTSNDDSRPLLKEKSKGDIQSMYEDRLPLYKEADIHLDTTGRSILEIVAELKSAMLK